MPHPDRIARTRTRMQAAGVDLLALSPGDDLYYLLGYTPHPDERPCYLFLTPSDAVFLVPELNAGQARGRV
ncbi:MAG: aminopeptidase P family N-terminal domain-containing protein, partial [Armatimonadetes bacterium]|nr:aminopeptidase P family N-terminal domain-containing protein [Armatimonadota bacterium]